jgi:flagellar basal-body rod modification protein FlgD
VVSIGLTTDAGAWTLAPGYPNPSASGITVRIPIVVPGSGGTAQIEIVNNIGQHIRTLDLGTLAAGATVVQWDGKSDAGREVAPGAYTAWLKAGSTRTGIRLVRVP